MVHNLVKKFSKESTYNFTYTFTIFINLDKQNFETHEIRVTINLAHCVRYTFIYSRSI